MIWSPGGVGEPGLWIPVLVFYGVMNLAALFMYGIDKAAARQGRWRTRESVLLGLSAVGGAFGGLLAMWFFRHKTRKWVFWAVNVLAAAVHAFVIGSL